MIAKTPGKELLPCRSWHGVVSALTQAPVNGRPHSQAKFPLFHHKTENLKNHFLT
uniref:Uncharacterized protein n=1 Tax=Chelonoidis abingdonii TaxID=106734 RepID=A0A8C0GXW9_CHEAB